MSDFYSVFERCENSESTADNVDNSSEGMRSLESPFLASNSNTETNRAAPAAATTDPTNARRHTQSTLAIATSTANTTVASAEPEPPRSSISDSDRLLASTAGRASAAVDTFERLSTTPDDSKACRDCVLTAPSVYSNASESIILLPPHAESMHLPCGALIDSKNTLQSFSDAEFAETTGSSPIVRSDVLLVAEVAEVDSGSGTANPGAEDATTGYYKRTFGVCGTVQFPSNTDTIHDILGALVDSVDPEKADTCNQSTRGPESSASVSTVLNAEAEAMIEAQGVHTVPEDRPLVPLSWPGVLGTTTQRTKQSSWHRFRCRFLVLLLSITIAVAFTMMAGFCAGGGCFAQEMLPSSAPISIPATRKDLIIQFINEVTQTGSNISELGASVESLALNWLIYDDPMKLSPDSPSNRFRIKQRYALALLWVQPKLASSFDNVGRNECEWTGTTCNATVLGDGIGMVMAVTEIKLTNPGTQIVSDLGLLSNLVLFNMTNNWESGKSVVLPDAIGNWTSLTHFDAEWSGLIGSLPSTIGRWTSLERFNANRNELTGVLPEAIGNWSNLEYFTAEINKFSGWFPSRIGKWSNLKHFDAAWNGFAGELPAALGLWTKLEHFNVDDNELEGSLPTSAGCWTNLTYFSSGSNQLTGSLPKSIANWTSLQSFNMRNNALSGSLPASIGEWTMLKLFDVANNSLTGGLPPSIGRWIKLESFQVCDNGLNGTLPYSIGQWSSLLQFNATANILTGSLPNSIENWGSLQSASFHGNHFAGIFPFGLCTIGSRIEISVNCDVNCTCCRDVCS